MPKAGIRGTPDWALSDWDSAEFLKTREAIRDYLRAMIAGGDDDPAIVSHALRTAARAHAMWSRRLRHRKGK